MVCLFLEGSKSGLPPSQVPVVLDEDLGGLSQYLPFPCSGGRGAANETWEPCPNPRAPRWAGDAADCTGLMLKRTAAVVVFAQRQPPPGAGVCVEGGTRFDSGILGEALNPCFLGKEVRVQGGEGAPRGACSCSVFRGQTWHPLPQRPTGTLAVPFVMVWPCGRVEATPH